MTVRVAVLQRLQEACCQNFCFAFPPRVNLSHPFLTHSSPRVQELPGMDLCVCVPWDTAVDFVLRVILE